MKKKIFAAVLAAALTLSASVGVMAEELVGSGWWTNVQTSSDYVMSGDSSVSVNVEVKEGEGVAFCAEIYADAWYFNTTSALDAWFAEGALDIEGSGIEGSVAGGDTSIVYEVGKTYTVDVTRAGNTITVVYKTEDGTEIGKIVGTNDSAPEELKLHIMSQVGTIDVTSETAAQEKTTLPVNTDATRGTVGSAGGDTTAAADSESGSMTTWIVVGVVVAVVVIAGVVVVVAKKKK